MDSKADGQSIRLSGLFKVLLLQAVMLFLAGGMLCPAPGLAAQQSAQVPSIEVEAEGEVLAKPDIASLILAVETQAPQAEEARAANARSSEALLKAMKGLLKSEEKIQSLSYRVFPIYQYKEKVQGGQKIRAEEIAGYKAVHSFRVDLKDMSRIGQVADAGLKSGANRVQGPFFDHSKKEELQQQAAVLALKRARELAEALAQAAGVKVTRLKKVSTAPPFRPLRASVLAERAMAPSAEAPPETPIEVGEEKFQARVAASFEVSQ
jgi:uncharacterized protein YggE